MSDLIPSVSGPEFPGEGKHSISPLGVSRQEKTVIEASLIPRGGGGSEFPGEGKLEEQIDFIDRKQGAEILERCFKERHAGGLKERLVWAIHDPMCPDVKSKERPLAAIHPLFLYAVIFVAAALAVFTYFHLK